MALPKKVKIGAHTYKVKLTVDLTDEDGQNLLGQIDYTNLLIEIRENMDPAWYLPTLMHEIVHGILFYTGQSTETSHEAVVSALGDGLAMMLHSSPQLLEAFGSNPSLKAPNPPRKTLALVQQDLVPGDNNTPKDQDLVARVVSE